MLNRLPREPGKRAKGRKAVALRRRRLNKEPLCRMCKERGRVTEATEVDHIVPLSQGGTDDDSNTRNLCNDCHRQATAEQFGYRERREIGTDGWPVE
jgi:5-methylcytosine-specific restriction enzyme A